ncbi:MAG: hypothetical protein BWK80_01385 [Desulfobacteraceae bacterium IS3]|nr:MAG: hypothetical protein BWK80_01385 [Desulfobacteraceae bacterium IS3]
MRKCNFHAGNAVSLPDSSVCVVSVEKLKSVSDFLLLSHNNVIQKNIRKSVKTAITPVEQMSSGILKNMKKIVSVCFGDIRRRIGFGTAQDALRCLRSGSSPVRNCPDEQIFIYT